MHTWRTRPKLLSALTKAEQRQLDGLLAKLLAGIRKDADGSLTAGQ